MPPTREKLVDVLGRNGVDASGLEELFDTGEGSIFGLRSGGGEEAMEVWEALYELVGQTGSWPLMLGTLTNLEQRRWAMRPGGPAVRQIIDAATPQLAEQWLAARRGSPVVGSWPETSCPAHTFHTPFDVESGQPLEQVILALLPTVRPWEVAGYLGFGGFNQCPPPAVHVALWRRWYDRWRAVPVAVTADTVEMLAERPPRNREEALELASEQHAYCGGAAENPAELAACLLGGSAWYFWWE